MSLLLEATSRKGCLMLTLPSTIAKKVLAWGKKNIPDEVLALDGREDYIHCTVLWGFDDDVTKSDVIPHLPDHPIELKLGKLKRFLADDNRPDSDVLVIEVDSPELQAWNTDLREEFKVESKYKDYKPHVTVAYVIPGSLTELDGTEITDDDTIECTELVYSSPFGTKKDILVIPDRISECYRRDNVVELVSFEEFLQQHAS